MSDQHFFNSSTFLTKFYTNIVRVSLFTAPLITV